MKKTFFAVVILAMVLTACANTPAQTGSTTSSGSRPDPSLPSSSQTAPTVRPTAPPATSTAPSIPTDPTVPPTEPSQPTSPSQPTQPPHTHSYGAWIVIQRQGCDRPEIEARICSCGHSQQRVSQEPFDHVYAADGHCVGCDRRISLDLTYELNSDGSGYTVISSHECTDSYIVIPETHQGLPVTAISYAAFAWTGITGVEISENVTSIGDSAFQDCYALKTVILPDNLRSIGSLAFAGTGLQSIFLPRGLVSMGREAFLGCDSLTSLQVDPENTAFASENNVLFNKTKTTLLCYLPGLRADTYEVPASVREIAASAFLGASRLTQVTLPESLETIGASAFAGTGLTSVTIPAGVGTIGAGAFGTDRAPELPGYGGCDDLQAIWVDEANGTFSSADGVLFNKDGTVLLTYPAGKTDTAYVLPEGVIAVASGAFRNARHLEKLTLSADVTTLGRQALAGCTGLTQLHFGGTRAQWETIVKDEGWDENTGSFTLICSDDVIA